MRPLVDTNIISELVRPTPDAKVRAWASRQTGFYLSVISVEEIRYGLSWRPNERVERWLATFFKAHCQLLSVTDSIAERAGDLRGQLQRRGENRSQADMLIAATAFEHNLTLVTRNERDFQNCEIEVLNPFR